MTRTSSPAPRAMMRATASENDCWIVLHGKAYDVTKFLGKHPGGRDVLIAAAGTDVTADFDAIHPPHVLKGIVHNPAITIKSSVEPFRETRSETSKTAVSRHLPFASMIPKLLCVFRVTNRIGLHALAVAAAISVLRDPHSLTLTTVACSFVLAFVIVAVCMSICLHRYFSHRAFETSRAFQVVIALVSNFAGQGGPLWWASKHGRHHAHCDLPCDPHSRKQTSLWYAWLGWFYNPYEVHVDSAYVKQFMKYPELILINELWFVAPLLVVGMSFRAIGFQHTVVFLTTPMFMAWIVTSWFNIEYHPAHSPTLPDERVCHAADSVRVLSEFVGESFHEDHHAYPQKACRPGLDPPYWLIIRPLLAIGLIWHRQSDKEHSS